MAKLEMETHRLAADALRQQDKDLGDLRARTGTLLTAASLIATFLGGQALERVGLTLWIVLALAAFGLAIALCIYVLLPKDGLTFGIDARRAYAALYEVRGDENAIDQKLANWLQLLREANHPTVVRLTRAFKAAGIALLVEIVLLAVGLAVS